jgi:hypothetical protein
MSQSSIRQLTLYTLLVIPIARLDPISLVKAFLALEANAAFTPLARFRLVLLEGRDGKEYRNSPKHLAISETTSVRGYPRRLSFPPR